ncbi:MAG: hypothetical protein ACOX2O_08250 [Bdellovibrionota bacterium]
MKTQPKYITFLGSTVSVLFTLIGFVLVLIYATLYEALQGTESPHRHVYDNLFFEAIILLIAANLFIAILRNLSSIKKNYALLLIFLGLELLIAGGLYTKHYGVHGTVLLAQNEKSSEIVKENSYNLLIEENNKLRSIPFDSLKKGQIVAKNASKTFTIDDVMNRSYLDLRVHNSTQRNLGIDLTYSNTQNNTEHRFWLIANSPFPEIRSERLFADTLLALRTLDTEPLDTPQLKIISKQDNTISIFNPSKDLNNITIAKKYKFENFKYFQKAEVHNGALEDTASLSNPAVEFDIIEIKSDARESHTRFAFIPNLPSLHGKASDKSFPLWIELVPAVTDFPQTLTKCVFEASATDEWYYSTDLTNKFPLSVGTEIQLPNNKKIHVNRLLTNAKLRRTAIPALDGDPALLIKDQSGKNSDWVSPLFPLKRYPNISFYITQTTQTLPFAIELLNINKLSQGNSFHLPSYQADIALHLAPDTESIAGTVTVNEPFYYNGYRFLLDSYKEFPVIGRFIIDRSPGTPLLCLGATLILLGIITAFLGKKGD